MVNGLLKKIGWIILAGIFVGTSGCLEEKQISADTILGRGIAQQQELDGYRAAEFSKNYDGVILYKIKFH